MRKSKILVGIAVTAVSLAGCQGLDSDEASGIFADCLERNGVEAQDVEVTMNAGSVDGISLVILGEGDVAYEPTVRLLCTEEVENQ